jgi:prepilin-type processing-associated H-X9-DG protein
MAIAMIVGLLAVVFMPTGCPRTLSWGPACLSNVKQLALGQNMYAGDFDDRLPPASGWANATAPYVSNIQVFSCPAIKDRSSDKFGHAFHRSLGLKKTSQIKVPENVVMLLDSTDLSWSATGGMELLPPEGRVMKRSAVAFADGHAKRVTRAQLFQQTRDAP